MYLNKLCKIVEDIHIDIFMYCNIHCHQIQLSFKCRFFFYYIFLFSSFLFFFWFSVISPFTIHPKHTHYYVSFSLSLLHNIPFHHHLLLPIIKHSISSYFISAHHHVWGGSLKIVKFSLRIYSMVIAFYNPGLNYQVLLGLVVAP